MLLLLLLMAPLLEGAAFEDRTHRSSVLNEERHYRLFLPPGYAAGNDRYPVIYYFHGHSDRYTLERYDEGKDTVPKIAAFVREHPVIVVAVDGYVARDYTGFYGGAPWDLYLTGGQYDFGPYFLELAAHIDATFRTKSSRRFRATSGLSMGGFMSLYLSARYPDMIGSASSFNPGPEFYTGEPGRRVLWRPKDHVANHTNSMVRLVRASGDYISQYHEETHEAYARASAVDYEYRRDEYHRHWATSIGETFAFHERAFAKAALDEKPKSWSHTNAYASFGVWDWDVRTDGRESGYTMLEDVTTTGFRIRTRRWAPDGPSLPSRAITVRTASLFQAGASVAVTDLALAKGMTQRDEVRADSEGRLTLRTDSEGHQFFFGSTSPILLPLTSSDPLRLPAGQEIALPVRVYNPRLEPAQVVVKIESEYPTVKVLEGSGTVDVGAGMVAAVPGLRVRLTAGEGTFQHARLTLTLNNRKEDIDVLIYPESLPAPQRVEVLDGRSITLPVFRQKGNQGGGASIERTLTEGKGNGNGILEPGEEATIWVQLKQGLDPFDKGNWYRARVFTDSKWVTESERLEEQKQLEWTGAKELTSVIRLSASAPAGAVIPLLLENESWSYTFTPDMRYGVEKLYQAFQLHRRHLHQWTIGRTRPSPAP